MHISAVSSYRKQLLQGFMWLNFAPGLEAEFRAYRWELMGAQMRIILATLGLFSFLFLLTDYFINGPGFSNIMIPARAFASILLIILLYCSTYPGPLAKYQGMLGMLLGLHMGVVALISNNLLGMREGMSDSTITYVATTYFIYLCFGLRFWQSLVVAGALFAGFAWLKVSSAENFVQILYPLMMMIFPNVLGTTVHYGIEYNNRHSFLLERDLRYLTRHDQLTGLWARNSLLEELQRITAHCYRERLPLSVAVVDIDFFKDYNDLYGHIKGDQCLCEIAAVVKSVANRPLDLVARFSGEEFVIVLPGCDQKQAVGVMQKLKEAVHNKALPHAASRVSDIVTVSVGVVDVYPHRDQLSTRKLLQLADEAMMEAKANGRDRIISCSRESELLLRLSSGNATAYA